MSKHIYAAEISYANVPVHLRDRFHFDEAKVKSQLLSISAVVDEAFILSNNNRFAVYVLNADITPLVSFFAGDLELLPFVQYFHVTEESIHHLFATASGLCSPVKGEHEILCDIERAHGLSLECESAGFILDNLLREAIRVGKKVRTETAIDKFCGSVIDAGFMLAEDRLDNLSDKQFLIIGTSAISRLAAEWLFFSGIKNVVIAGENQNQVRELCARYMAKYVALENLEHYFLQSDVIIGGAHHKIDLFEGASAFPQTAVDNDYHLTKSRIILDMGIPRNFSDTLRIHSGIELYTLDDLKIMQHTPLDSFGGVSAAWDIVMSETRSFSSILRQLAFSPVRASHWTKLVDIKDREINWLFPKVSDVSERDRNMVRKYIQQLIRNPKDKLKDTGISATGVKSKSTIDAIKRLYNKYNIDLNTSSN